MFCCRARLFYTKLYFFYYKFHILWKIFSKKKLRTWSLLLELCAWKKERERRENCSNQQNLVSLSYLEVEDDCPNEAECELGVAVHNVLPPDVDQLDLLVPGDGNGFQKLLSERQWTNLRNLSAVSTFWIAWKRIRPRSRGWNVEISQTIVVSVGMRVCRMKKASWLLASRQKVTGGRWVGDWVRGRKNGSFAPLLDSTGPPGEDHGENLKREIKHEKNISSL